MTDWLYSMPSNWTQNVTDVSKLLLYVSDELPMFPALVLLVIFSTSFISLKRYTTERALMPSLFITALMGTFMFYIGLLEATWIVFLWVAVGLSYIIGHYYQKLD